MLLVNNYNNYYLLKDKSELKLMRGNNKLKILEGNLNYFNVFKYYDCISQIQFICIERK